MSQNQPASNREMAGELRRIYEHLDPFSSTFLNRQQVGPLRQAVRNTSHPAEKARLLLRLSHALLNIGENHESIQCLEEARKLFEQIGGAPDPKFQSFLETMIGVNWLRIGELENCVTNHTNLSCLAPIAPGGVHALPHGSSMAMDHFKKVLAANPLDLRARWLYNVAAMTLGKWPGEVPPSWLIPPAAFASNFDIKRFPEIAGNLGLNDTDLAGGVVADDLDNDGNLDLLVSGWGIDSPLRFYHNNGDGTFTERGKEAGLEGLTGALNMNQADYDNDEFVDVLLLRGGWLGLAGHYPVSLLHNNGDGTFTDVTKAAGLFRRRPTQTAAWLDYNGDGWIDVFIGNESWDGDPNPCELYRNNGDGTFTDVAAEAGLNLTAIVKGVTAGDFNNDGRPDLYLSLRPGANRLYRNDGPAKAEGGPKSPWKFTDVAPAAGVTEPIYSFPTWFFDYDNDGWEDLFVAGYGINDVGDVAADSLGVHTGGATSRLYRNNHDGTFQEVSQKTHLHKVLLAMGCNFGDLDNDGWLDFYLGTGDPDLSTVIPNRMFRNDGGKDFQDVTTSGGFGHLQKGHGIAFADFDNDGDQDVFAVMGGAFESDVFQRALFENPGHSNHWIKLKLEGKESNRAAIGARLKLEIEEDGQTRVICKTVNTGSSFGSNPLRQEIGLAGASAVRKLEIFWPTTGKTQSITNLAADTTWYIQEGAPKPISVPLKQITWKRMIPMMHHSMDHESAPGHRHLPDSGS